jgi:hypothetical protein
VEYCAFKSHFAAHAFTYGVPDHAIRGLLLRLTNDGNAILREIDVAHPAAKNMIDLSRTQDEEVGDGTTSVIILGVPRSCAYRANLLQ